ncbi:MAG: vitamin K epoxide reductase family protein [Actinomycetota bacterium]|nr:vitamin K epoxide reductase family protein [Actinomycetota bacterium]
MTRRGMPVRLRPSGPPAASVPARGGIGRGSSAYAERVSDDLRRGASADLVRRRRATALTLLATGALAVAEAYPGGAAAPRPRATAAVARRRPRRASGEAYRLFGTPDAALGIASFGATLVLHGAGPGDRAESRPWLPLLAAAKTVGDAAASVFLFAEQVSGHRRLCSWCTLAAVANVAAVPAVLPEARRALRALQGPPLNRDMDACRGHSGQFNRDMETCRGPAPLSRCRAAPA